MVNGERRFRLVSVAVLLVVTAACAPAETPSAGGLKEELVVAAGKDNSRPEPPPRANVATGYGNANAPVFETLVMLAPDFSLEPLLATSWQFREPGTWRFQLRRGVMFHDGTPFNAAAVVYNVTELWAKDPASILGLAPDSARAVDEHTVDITPATTNMRLVEQLVHPLQGIQAPGTYAGSGEDPTNTPTGTGPFRFSSYVPGQHLKVERFDGYWGEKPPTQRITFRFVDDDSTRVAELTAGTVDAIYDVPRELPLASGSGDGVRVMKSPVGAYAALLLNHTGRTEFNILAERPVRQAVATAIDKATIVQSVWKGNAEVMNTLIPAAVLGKHAGMVKGHPHDPADARRLLEGAGWTLGSDGVRSKGGRRLVLTMVVSDNDAVRPAPELVQSQLKDIGIQVNIDVPGVGAYFERLEQGRGDIFVERGSQNDGNPIFLGALFTAETGGFADYAASFAAGPDYDRIFTAAMRSPDTEEVRRLAAEAMHIAVDDVVAVVPLAGIYQIWGLRDNVRGFVPHPSAASQRWSAVHAQA